MDRHARKRLRESLEADGLVEMLVWNERTGTLVGGHQRLALLDERHGGTDYSIEVAAVDLDEARERALNVRLNNPSSQGSYDFDALERLLADESVKIDADKLGFDELDLQALFPGRELASGAASLFSKEGDQAQPAIDEMKEWKSRKRKKDREADSAEFYVVFVGRDAAHVAGFLERLGLDASERFHDLSRLESHLSETPPA